MTTDKDQEVLSKVSNAAKTSIGVHTIMKIVSFLCNIFTIRSADIKLYGIANVSLKLLYTTITFLAREPFRKVCIDLKEAPYYQINNLVWLVMPIGLFLSLFLSIIWIFILETPDIPSYPSYVAWYCISAMIELLSEPLYIFFQSHLYLQPKIYIESISLLIYQVLVFVFTTFYPQWNMMTYIVAQLIYTSIISLSYVIAFYYYKSRDSSFPLTSLSELSFKTVPNEPHFSVLHIPLLIVFFKQSIIKQLLTESEKYVMTFFNLLTYTSQGMYTFISNIGNLVTRMIFLPLEDAFFIYFSKEFSDSNKIKLNMNKVMIPYILLKFLFYFGLTLSVFGYWYSPLLLFIFGGNRYVTEENIVLMRGCCIYVAIIGLNGISEGFFMATAEKEKIHRFNYSLIGLSVLFVYYYSALEFLHCCTKYFGALGLTIANSVTMIIRILHHLLYLYRTTSIVELHLTDFIEPVLIVVAGYCVASLALKISYIKFHLFTIHDIACHILCGIVILVCCLLSILIIDKDFFGQISYIIGVRKIKTKEPVAEKEKTD